MKITLTGVLVKHQGHELRTSTRYEAEPGRVYGQPHLRIDCLGCLERVWDEKIGASRVTLAGEAASALATALMQGADDSEAAEQAAMAQMSAGMQDEIDAAWAEHNSRRDGGKA